MSTAMSGAPLPNPASPARAEVVEFAVNFLL